MLVSFSVMPCRIGKVVLWHGQVTARIVTALFRVVMLWQRTVRSGQVGYGHGRVSCGPVSWW